MTQRDIKTTVTDPLEGGPSRSRIEDVFGMLEALARHLVGPHRHFEPWEASMIISIRRHVALGHKLSDKQLAVVRLIFTRMANRLEAA